MEIMLRLFWICVFAIIKFPTFINSNNHKVNLNHKYFYQWSDSLDEIINSKKLLNLCPASTLLNTLQTGTLSYPQDLFDPLQSMHVSQLFNCSSTEEPTTFHSCSIGGEICPVHRQNILRSLHLIDYKLRESLCMFNSEEQISTIYIMGGSVTAGHGTQGCCCDLDSNCPINSNRSEEDPCHHFEPKSFQFDGRCGWVDSFTKVINNFFPKVKIVNLVWPGTTSAFITILHDVKSGIFSSNYNFTSRDIVIIDYSVNDCKELSGELPLIEFGMEGLIRHVMQSQANVFILENIPLGPYNQSVNQFAPMPYNGSDYSTIYRKLAAYYNIPIISYREVVWDTYMIVNQSYLFAHLKWDIERMIYSNREHPTWFSHLFYADLLSISMMTVLNICNMDSNAFIYHNRTHYKLPKPLSHHSIQGGCNINSIVPIYVNAFDEYHSKFRHQRENISNYQPYFKSISKLNDHDVEAFKTIPYSHNWFLYEDVPGKPGYITNSSYAIIHFPISIPIGFTNGETDRSKLIIKITFLRTYQNTGFVEVFLSGHSIGIIDSAWNNGNRISVLQVAYFTICLSEKFININKAKTDDLIPLEILHQFNNEKTDRGIQKFKIVSVSTCLSRLDDYCAFAKRESFHIAG